MPRIIKLTKVEGGLGVVLDIPPTPTEGDSVSIYTAQELEDLKKRIRNECAQVCEELADSWAEKEDEMFALARAASEIRKL